jgi:hypothetical protein
MNADSSLLRRNLIKYREGRRVSLTYLNESQSQTQSPTQPANQQSN